MGDLEVFIPCDHSGCNARSRDIWTKQFDDNIWPLTFCAHHADKLWATLSAQGWHPLESEALTK
jgi:hypothetical protein